MKKAKCLFSKQDIQTLRETQQKSQQAIPLYVTISTKQLQEQLWQTVVYTQGLWVTKHQLLSGDIQFRMNSLLEQYHVYSRWMAKSWWRHQMETFSALLAICAGNSPVTAEFPAQRPVTRSFDVFLICVWINDWANNREAGDFRRHSNVNWCSMTQHLASMDLAKTTARGGEKHSLLIWYYLY